MEENEILDKMHPLHLVLADELKRICEKYDIKYFMIAGTLLGAVRHGGFVPWDDDMDFGILRTDYEKFISLCDKELDKDIFCLQTEQNEKFYPFGFAKLSLTGTEFKEEVINKFNVHEGIYIDIFPFDTVPNSNWERWIQYKVFHITNRLIKLKTGFFSKYQKRTIQHYIGCIISKVFPITFLKTIRYNCITRYMNEDSKYVVNGDGAYGIEKETLRRKWVEDIKDYSFEDRIYPGIADYDDYLTYFYGNYMTPPPTDERKHHRRIMVDFGQYS